MNAGIEPGGQQAMIERIKGIILKPKDEWPKIERESASQGELLRRWVLPLAAIGPIADFIGGQVFGYTMFFVTWRPPLVSALGQAVVGYLLMIAAVYIVSYIADFLAPKFEGQSNKDNAFKLVAYGWTAAWLVGIIGLIPSLWLFKLLGLYSFYLIYTGVTPLMRVPDKNALVYTIVTVLCGGLAMILAGMVASLLIPRPGLDSLRDSVEISGSMELPGGSKIDLGEAQKVQERFEAAVSGQTKPLTLDGLKGLMPEKLGSYERIAIQTNSVGPIGSFGEATYRSGDRQFRLTVSDVPTAGAVAGLVGAFGGAQDREDENGYQRTGNVNGQMQTEEWNHTSNRGKFGKVVANRFIIEADGSAESIGELKDAVNAIDTGDLAGLVD